MYGERIKYFRKKKGYSQAEIADLLSIEAPTFSKIETNQTRLSVDMLEKIASILEVSPMEIMKDEPIVVNFNDSSNNNGTVNSWINAETVFNYNKELVDKLFAAKENEIAVLKATIETLQELLNVNRKES